MERRRSSVEVIADILRLEEESPASTEAALKQLLTLLESDKSVSEIELALARINVAPQEPVLIK